MQKAEVQAWLDWIQSAALFTAQIFLKDVP